ncbi:hypothetical protein [Glycomyces buryatensis]|uniref:Uncharacterized protein n=1 Tax=Glycomyces buryatensis TaxID=2570927 RepID=A0A4S8QAV6_9ACTN|nr:hypothetical protein [Glycomyces buryatensis]THV40641.1 hypothetical protein FAB82_15380 [Glycomyces buryatensis]
MAGGYSDIDDGSGEIIHVGADDSADGVKLVQNGEQIIVVDEDALTVFSTKTGQTLDDLEPVRSLVTGGQLNNVPQFGQYGDMQFQSIDAQNLKLGNFPEAQALSEAYFKNFYQGSADQVERVHHGIATGKTVAGDTMASYLDNDGNVAADVTSIDSEFAGTGLITSSEFDELQEGTETEEPSASEPAPEGGSEESAPPEDPTDSFATNF